MTSVRETGLVQLLGLPLSLRDIAEAAGRVPPISLRDMLRAMTLRTFGAVVTTPDPEALSGNVDLTIWADGRYELKVHMHDSGLADYSFRLGIILRSGSGKAALAFYSRGVAHGTLSFGGNRDSDERQAGQLAALLDNWEDFAAGSFTVVREYQNDLVGWIASTFLEIATFIIGAVTLGAPAACMIFGATLARDELDLGLPGELGLFGILLADGVYYLCGPTVFIPVFIGGALVSAALFKRRPLSDSEIALARTVFADTIPYSKVWVTNLEGPEGRWFTTVGYDGTVTLAASSEFDDLVSDSTRQAIFIHEMTHAWQHAHSPTLAILCESTWLRTREFLEGKHAVYDVDRNDLQAWDSYNWEQQGDLIRNAFVERGTKPPEDRPFERYVLENILVG